MNQFNFLKSFQINCFGRKELISLNNDNLRTDKSNLGEENKLDDLDPDNPLQNNIDAKNPFAAKCIIPLPGAAPETWVIRSLKIYFKNR